MSLVHCTAENCFICDGQICQFVRKNMFGEVQIFSGRTGQEGDPCCIFVILRFVHVMPQPWRNWSFRWFHDLPKMVQITFCSKFWTKLCFKTSMETVLSYIYLCRWWFIVLPVKYIHQIRDPVCGITNNWLSMVTPIISHFEQSRLVF